MRSLIVTILFMSFSNFALAAKIECTTSEHRFTVQNQNNDIVITFKGETVLADGLLSTEEVDLVAKFKSAGEMTLFAKVGQNSPENYVFIQGKRFSVTCR